MHEFWSVEHERVVLDACRVEFNAEHPHGSLGYLTRAQFATNSG